MNKILATLILISFPFLIVCNSSGLMMGGGTTITATEGIIGYTDDTGSTRNALHDYQYHYPTTPTQAGNIRYGHIKVDATNTEEVAVCVSIADNLGNELASCSGTSVNGGGWINCDHGSEVSISGGTTYYLYTNNDSVTQVVFDTADTNSTMYYCDLAYACDVSIDALEESSLSGSPDRITIIWNNTSGDPS